MRALIVTAILLVATAAAAWCTTTSVIGPGGTVLCTRCCTDGNCSVVCF